MNRLLKLAAQAPLVVVSLVSYSACLFLPAFYVGSSFHIFFGWEALATGWISLNLSWFANPLYLASLLTYRIPYVSFWLSLLGLVLALSFLFQLEVPVDSRPTYEGIAAYGYGYMLWLWSFVCLMCARLPLSFGWRFATKRESGGWALLGCAVFAFPSLNSLGNYRDYIAERTEIFDQYCGLVNEAVYQVLGQIPDGVYLNHGYHTAYPPGWSSRHVLPIFPFNLETLKVPFHERDAVSMEPYSGQPYVRFQSLNTDGVGTSSLASEIGIYSEPFEIDPDLELFGYRMYVERIADESLLGEFSFIADERKNRTCPDMDGNFSTKPFLDEIFNGQVY